MDAMRDLLQNIRMQPPPVENGGEDNNDDLADWQDDMDPGDFD